MEYQIMQGDQYDIRFTISDTDGNEITEADVSAVEFVVGCIKKKYPGDIKYRDNWWMFLLTQEDSMKLEYRIQHAQVRVKFKSGEVIGKQIGPLKVLESVSKEVL